MDHRVTGFQGTEPPKEPDPRLSCILSTRLAVAAPSAVTVCNAWAIEIGDKQSYRTGTYVSFDGGRPRDLR